MRVDARASRARRLSLTSLIDVIFLLLLFFMLSSTFTRFAEVELSGGRASAGTSGVPDILIRLDGGGWQVNGMALDGADAVANEISRLQDSGAESAVLLVRDGATSQELVTTVEAVRRESDIPLSVAR